MGWDAHHNNLSLQAFCWSPYLCFCGLSSRRQAHHHLSKLPNMAFSCALAKFHASGASGTCKVDDVDETLAKEADRDVSTVFYLYSILVDVSFSYII